MKLICKCLGGSFSYGLNTSNSDKDFRGVFLNTDISSIIGLDRHDHQQKQNDSEDEVYTEFRHALRMLRQGNTQIIELLYNDDWIEISDEWKLVQKHRHELLDSERLFNCLRGYMQGELRLANGERTGKLGSKRKEAIEKYNFSPKNFCQLLRLARAGCVYFEQGFFPVNIAKYNPGFGAYLLNIKTNPQDYTKEQLNQAASEFEKQLVTAYENRKFNTKFNHDLANKLCLDVYGPIVNQKFLNLS